MSNALQEILENHFPPRGIRMLGFQLAIVFKDTARATEYYMDDPRAGYYWCTDVVIADIFHATSVGREDLIALWKIVKDELSGEFSKRSILHEFHQESDILELKIFPVYSPIEPLGIPD